MGINTAELNELGELMESVRTANDWSYGDIARNTEGIVGVKPLSRSNVQRLATDYPLVSITRGAVLSLSAGMRVSPDRVALAAVQAMGFRPPVSEVTAAEAVQRDASLDDRTRNAILAIIRSAAGTRAG